MSEGERPHPRFTDWSGICFEDAADHHASGEQVVIVLVPFPGGDERPTAGALGKRAVVSRTLAASSAAVTVFPRWFRKKGATSDIVIAMAVNTKSLRALRLVIVLELADSH